MGKLNVTMTYKAVGGVVDITDRVLSMSVDESVDSATSKFTLVTKDIHERHPLDDVVISYDGEVIYRGIVESQQEKLTHKYRKTTFKGTDVSLKLDRKVVREIYTPDDVQGGKPEEIIKALVSKYAPYLTVNNVQDTGKTIDIIAFNYEPLKVCIDRVANLVGWNWYVDEELDLHFYDRYEGQYETKLFTTKDDLDVEPNIMHDSFSVDYSVTKKTANRVWVVGALTASQSSRDEYFTADGNNSIFKVASRPRNYEIYVDGAKVPSEKVKADTSYNETDENVEWLVNYADKYIRAKSAPVSGTEIRFNYFPEVQIIDYFEDPDSVAKYGLFEKALLDRKITEKETARQRGRAELKRNSQVRRKAEFRTRDLSVKRGQILRLVLPEMSIDSTWRVTSVLTDISAPDRVNYSKKVVIEEIGGGV